MIDGRGKGCLFLGTPASGESVRLHCRRGPWAWISTKWQFQQEAREKARGGIEAICRIRARRPFRRRAGETQPPSTGRARLFPVEVKPVPLSSGRTSGSRLGTVREHPRKEKKAGSGSKGVLWLTWNGSTGWSSVGKRELIQLKERD